MSNPPVGEKSRPLRFFIVGIFVVVWWLAGAWFHLSLPEYLMLGIPILLVFQLWVHRQPVRKLWVRSGPAFRVSGWFVALFILFALFPAYASVRELAHQHIASGAEYAFAVIGAFGMTYAVRSMNRKTWIYAGLCALTVIVLGVFPQMLSLVLPHLVHIHSPHSVTAAKPSLLQSLKIGSEWLLLMPVGFTVEEVFFRGALDTYLHRGEKGTGWVSAIFVSALWGLWHVSMGPHLLSTIVSDVVAQTIIGVPLSLWWRKSGNLVVNDSAHALLEGVRNAIVGAGVF